MVKNQSQILQERYETLPLDLNNDNASLYFMYPNDICFSKYINYLRLHKSQPCLQYENKKHLQYFDSNLGIVNHCKQIHVLI